MADLLRLFLWSVAVVMTKRPLEKPVLPSKSAMTCETNVSRSAATSPLIFARLCGNLVPLVYHRPLGVRFQHAATSRQRGSGSG